MPRPGRIGPGESRRCLIGLGVVNFFVAAMQTGFGAFLTVFLTAHLWSKTDIGFALGVGTVVAMVAQVPAGALVDAVHHKRIAAALAMLTTAGSALLIALWPSFIPVAAAEAAFGIAAAVLTPCIAAITLALARLEVLGERLGNNVRFAALGSAAAAAAMGAVGFWISHQFVFFVAAGCGVAALGGLAMIRGGDMAAAPARTDHHAAFSPRALPAPPAPKRHVAMDRRLVVFAACLVLFSLGNAALLPIAANTLTHIRGQTADLTVGAAILVPQALAAVLSPSLGRAAQSWGRRPVLMLGFAALPLRAALFALGGSNPFLLVAYQALDGVSSGVIGVMLPLVVADLTRRRGRFNLAMGELGLAVGIGATISNTVGGYIADAFGNMTAFAGLGAAGLAACALCWLVLPETGPELVVAPAPA